MTAHLRTCIALGLLVAMVATAGCDGSSSSASAQHATTTAAPAPTTASTTTTAPPEPIRLVVGGDSVVYDVAPALQAALPPAAASVEYLVAPAIAKGPIRAQLGKAVSTARADALVVMVGIWERVYVTSSGLRLGDPGFAAAYAAEVLDPLTSALAPTRTTLVLVREPAMRDAGTEADLVALSQVWSQYAASHPDTVRYLDSSIWLDGPRGYEEAVPGVAGLVRARRIDGLHLCATGAARIAQGLIDNLPAAVGRPWPAASVPGWETGPWTGRFPADACPPT